MRAVVMRGPGELVVEEVTDPSPAPGEAVIEVEHCGICGIRSVYRFWEQKTRLAADTGS